MSPSGSPRLSSLSSSTRLSVPVPGAEGADSPTGTADGDATGSPHPATDGPVVLVSARGFDPHWVLAQLVAGAHDASRLKAGLFQGLEGAALVEAVRQVLALMPAELPPTTAEDIQGSLQALLPVDSPGAVDAGLQPSLTPAHLKTAAPWIGSGQIEAAIDSIVKGKDADGEMPDAAAWVQARFPGLPPGDVDPLLLHLQVEARRMPLSSEARRLVRTTLNHLRTTHPDAPSQARKTRFMLDLGQVGSPSQLLSRDIHRQVNEATRPEEGLEGALRSARALRPSLRWAALCRLKGDLAPNDPVLAAVDAAIEEAYVEIRQVRLSEAEQTRERMTEADCLDLRQLADWGRDPAAHPVPGLIVEDDVASSLELWRFMLLRHKDRLSQDESLNVRAALDRLKAASGATTNRDRIHHKWVGQVTVSLRQVRAGKDNSGGAADFLAQLKQRLGGGDAAVALALETTLDSEETIGQWPHGDRLFLYRAAALLIARHDQPLAAIAHPGRPVALQPKTLRRFPPALARKNASDADRVHHEAASREYEAHSRLAAADEARVGQVLAELALSIPDAGDGGAPHRDTTATERCDELLVRTGLSINRLTAALGKVAARASAGGRLAGELRDELIYSLRNDSDRHVPMSARQLAAALARGGLNGVREGSAHYAAFLAWRAADAYLVQAGGPFTEIPLGVIGSIALPLLSLYRLETAKSADYKANPSWATDALLKSAVPLTVAGAAAMLCGVVWGGLGASVLTPFVVNNLARLTRQAVQSWTQGPLTAGLALRHRDGSGLSAQEQYRLNTIRDSLYVLSSLALLVYGPTLAEQLLTAVLSDTVSAGGVSTLAAARLVASGLNELLDGINPDLARLIFRRWYGEAFMLQPDAQANPGPDPGHFLDQTATRVLAGAPVDALFALADALRGQGLDRPALTAAAAGALLNGLLGSMRGRALGYLRTIESVVENGTRMPNGLLSLIGSGASTATGSVRRWWSVGTGARGEPTPLAEVQVESVSGSDSGPPARRRSEASPDTSSYHSSDYIHSDEEPAGSSSGNPTD